MKKNRKKMILSAAALTALALFAGCTSASAVSPVPTAAVRNVASAPTEARTITADEAASIAYAHAGVSGSEVRDRSREFDDGIWEIDFDHGGWEYDYDISAEGTILRAEKEPERTAGKTTEAKSAETQPAETTPAESKPAENKSSESKREQTQRISREEALTIALNHAGVTDARDREAEWDDGRWEVSFDSGSNEYDYHISADGTILWSEKEPERTAGKSAEAKSAESKPAEKKSGESKSAQTQRISREKALSIALEHAGVTDARDRDVEWDDGRWEVSFDSGRTEYDYDISADGTILRWEKETDD